jgi:hypothetical protein
MLLLLSMPDAFGARPDRSTRNEATGILWGEGRSESPLTAKNQPVSDSGSVVTAVHRKGWHVVGPGWLVMGKQAVARSGLIIYNQNVTKFFYGHLVGHTIRIYKYLFAIPTKRQQDKPQTASHILEQSEEKMLKNGRGSSTAHRTW